jgi:thymidylate synthase
MINISGDSIDEIFALGWNQIHHAGMRMSSRAGPVISCPSLAVTEYFSPEQRVLFLEERDHNPFFALMETIWMLAGRNDVEFLLKYNKRMLEYSDNGETLTGSAYGYQWFHGFGFNQILKAASEIIENPETRRVVISHWDPYKDPLNKGSLDLPCNLQILFRVFRGFLDMTVYNRSNDFIYGQAGSNAVHFSLLHELMAALTGYMIGKYTQVSNNLHLYTDNPVYKRIYEKYGQNIPVTEPYEVQNYSIVDILPRNEDGLDGLFGLYELFMGDVDRFVGGQYPMLDSDNYSTDFFKKVVVPMEQAHSLHRGKRTREAIQALNQMPKKNDWRNAGLQWLQRRLR